MVAFTAHTRGAAGAVISGSINDVDEIAALGFPVFSSGVSARTTRISGIEGAINVSVSVGGVTIEPGDLVLGDSDGLAVIKPEEALALACLLSEKEAREPGTRDRIRSGGRLSSISGASKFFEVTSELQNKIGAKI
jgi:regulator of RNase E activity RraA